MINSVGLQGPGVEALARGRAAGAASATGARVVASHLGPHRRGLRARRRRCWPARRPRSSRSRSTCPARTPRPARDLFAHSAAHRGGDRGDGRVRPAALGQAQPQRRPTSSRSPAPRRGPGPRRSRSSTRCMGMAIDPETAALRLGSGPGAGACRARRSTRSRCGPCTTCTRRLPGPADRRRRAVWPAARRGGAAARRAPARSQVGTATFADPRRRTRVLEELEGWASRQGVRRVPSDRRR